MPPELEKAKSPEVSIEKSPLLKAVFDANIADKKKRSDEIVTRTTENFEHVVEVEHRYLPSGSDGILDYEGKLSHELVMKLPGAYMRKIEQTYVDARIPDSKNTERFRLRRTTKYGNKGEIVSRERRIALKNRLADNPNARVETQVILHPADPRDAEKILEFEKLWKGKERYSFDRYYVRHDLPIPDEFYVENGYPVPRANDRYCEIHIERRHAPPPELEGMVRIEVEFPRTSDEKFVKENKNVLPRWIGPSVTEVVGYNSKNLFKRGPPKEYFEHMEKVKKDRWAAAKSRRRQAKKRLKREKKQRKREKREREKERRDKK